MKKRLRKKLRQKESRTEITTPALGRTALASLATELWRMRKMITNRSHWSEAAALNIIEKCEQAVRDLGAEVEDPYGLEYRDGMTMSVLVFEECNSLHRGVHRISETVSPAVYFCDKLIEPAKVIVSIGTGERDGQND
jgi:hypothetical protein